MQTSKRVGWALATLIVATLGARASALDPWSFTDRVQQNMRIGAATPDYMFKTGDTAMTSNPDDYYQPASFIARIDREQRIAPREAAEGPSGTAYAGGSPDIYFQPASFIARVEQSQRVGSPILLDSESQLSPEQLRMVQRALYEKGYSTQVNGKFDEGTRSSLISFQRSNDLPMTGTLDARTVDALGFDARQVTPVRAPAQNP